MCYYLIDIENIPTDWIKFITDEESDSDQYCYIIVYTENSKRMPHITWDDFNKLTTALGDNRLQIHKTTPGKDSCDKIIISLIGYYCNEIGTDSINVISNDSGFDNVIEFWNNRNGCSIVKRINIQDIMKVISE